MGQRISRKEEAALQPGEEEKGSGFLGQLLSPNAEVKRTRNHVDRAEQDLPDAKKKPKTEEEMRNGGAFSHRLFSPFKSKPEVFGEMPASPEKQTAADGNSAKQEVYIPKPPLGSFNAFSMDRRAELKRENPNVGHLEITKMLGEEWRASSELRKEYYDRQDKLKAEYEAKMAELGLPLPKRQKKEIRQKQKKEGECVDHGKPKRPLSAFNLYKGEYRRIIRRENPGATAPEIRALVVQQWRELSEDLRGKYMSEYGKSLEAYHEEMAKWRATQAQKGRDEGKQEAPEPATGGNKKTG